MMVAFGNNLIKNFMLIYATWGFALLSPLELEWDDVQCDVYSDVQKLSSNVFTGFVRGSLTGKACIYNSAQKLLMVIIYLHDRYLFCCCCSALPNWQFILWCRLVVPKRG